MSNFVISQTLTFKSGQAAVDVGNGRIEIQAFDGQTNSPINLDHVRSFGPSAQKITDQLAYPTIEFDLRTVMFKWYYPPTEDGKAARDADIMFLFSKHCSTCPVDNPLANR